MTRYCEGCTHSGLLRVPATKEYHWPDGSGDVSPCCQMHFDQWSRNAPGVLGTQAVGQGGPYRGETGSKGGGDSAEAAKRWNGKAGDLRRKVLVHVAEHGAQGADDIAATLGEHFLDIRPRCSELTKEAFGELLQRVRLEGVRTARNAPAWAYGLTAAGKRAVDALKARAA
ncbi:hypothetical protein KUV46_15815 [Thalassovita mediterranea]|nr:hypothetical protein KUV46_15815 [Thalassovita mediterranea]